MTSKPSKAELAMELEELRARLAEAEEVLRAIRNGDVDAVVVEGGRGEQVYTLSGADRIYRQLIEAMSEGAATLSADGVIRYANQTFARLFQTPLERVIGTEFRSFVSPADQPALASLIEAAVGGSSHGEMSVRVANGSFVPLRLGLSQLQLDPETLLCMVATDLTEEKKNAAALRDLHAGLEKRVEERTADLAASRLAALNMMEEAVEAQKVAEATNRHLEQEMAERTRLAAIVEQSNDAIISRGLDRRIRTWNAGAVRIFGWSVEEAIGQYISMITPPGAAGRKRSQPGTGPPWHLCAAVRHRPHHEG